MVVVTKKKISNRFLAENLFFWLIVTLVGSLILLIWPKELLQLVTMEKLIDKFDQVTLMLRFFALFSILICMTEILGGILVSKGKIMFQYGNKLLTVCSSILLLLTFLEGLSLCLVPFCGFRLTRLY